MGRTNTDAAGQRSSTGKGSITTVENPVNAPYGYALVTLARQHQAYLDALTAKYGISSAHVPLLSFLWAGNSGGTQNEIARALKVDKGTVSRAVRTLVNANLITQTQCTHDTRACTIELTQEGWELADPISAISKQWADEVARDFSDEERSAFSAGLARLSDRAERLVEDAQAERARTAISTTVDTLQPATAAAAMLAEPEGV